MSAPIDIYTYPENATPLEQARYEVAVREAIERGEQCIDRAGGEWLSDVTPLDFHYYKLRIARPKIAEGHNPDKLTEAQVGVQDGWRLLSVEEIKESERLFRSSSDTSVGNREEFYRDGRWRGPGYCRNDGLCYRTRQPIGHYLPKPAAEPVAETREETRRERIATIVQLIRNGSETADQIAARIELMLNQPAK